MKGKRIARTCIRHATVTVQCAICMKGGDHMIQRHKAWNFTCGLECVIDGDKGRFKCDLVTGATDKSGTS